MTLFQLGEPIRELIADDGYVKTILDDYCARFATFPAHLRADRLPARQDLPIRPLAPQLRDPGRPRPGIRRGFAVVCCLGCRGPAPGRSSSPRRHPTSSGDGPLPFSAGGAAGMVVWDREAAVHHGGGQPTDEFAAFCGSSGSAG